MRKLGGKRLLFAGLIVLVSLCAIAYFGIFSERYLYVANRDSSSGVAAAFAFSLIRNKVENAKQLTTPANWEVLERWNEGHKPLSTACRLPFDPDLSMRWVGSGDETSHMNYYYSITFQCPEGLYRFDIDVTLERSEAGWEVVSWGEICEGTIDNEQCYSPGEVP